MPPIGYKTRNVVLSLMLCAGFGIASVCVCQVHR